MLKRYHKIYWLSKWQAITTLCDSLEFVIIYLHDAITSRDDGLAPLLYAKLHEFKFIYILYFLANILKMLSTLSKIFQSKLVDISSLGSIVKIEMASIRMCFFVDSCDLNQDTFNPSTSFQIILEYGPPDGYLCCLLSKIRESRFHSIDMIINAYGVDLKVALNFQKLYVEAVCVALDARFDDNDIIDSFKKFDPIHMPQKQFDWHHRMWFR